MCEGGGDREVEAFGRRSRVRSRGPSLGPFFADIVHVVRNEVIQKASTAAKGICKWVRSLEGFSEPPRFQDGSCQSFHDIPAPGAETLTVHHKVRAMIVYDGVAKVVGPKKEASAQWLLTSAASSKQSDTNATMRLQIVALQSLRRRTVQARSAVQ